MRSLQVAVLGATGAVGHALVQALEEAELPLADVRLLASEHGAGAELDFRGELHRAQAVAAGAFDGCDLAFFAAGAAPARAWAGPARAAGCSVIDLSPAFRDDPDVPLVLPELGDSWLERWRHPGVVSIPGPAATQLALVLAPLHAAAGVERAVVASYEAVSGAGRRGVEALESELRAMLSFQEPPPPTALPHRIAFNVVPQVGPFGDDGATEAERATADELARLLGPGGPRLALTAVRVPIFYGYSHAVNIRTARPLGAAAARAVLAQAPGVKVIDDPGRGVYPMPMLTVNDDAVLVGRVRDDPTQEHGLQLFVAADNLRRGAAVTALEVARRLAARHLAG